MEDFISSPSRSSPVGALSCPFSSRTVIGRSSAPQMQRLPTKALRISNAPLHEYSSMSSCTAGASTKVPIPLPDMAIPYANAFLRWK